MSFADELLNIGKQLARAEGLEAQNQAIREENKRLREDLKRFQEQGVSVERDLATRTIRVVFDPLPVEGVSLETIRDWSTNAVSHALRQMAPLFKILP